MQTPPDGSNPKLLAPGKMRREVVFEAWELLRKDFMPWVFSIVLLMIVALSVNLIESLFIQSLNLPTDEQYRLHDLLNPGLLRIQFFGGIFSGAFVTIAEGGILGAALARLRMQESKPVVVPFFKIDGTGLQLGAFGAIYGIVMFLLQTLLKYILVWVTEVKDLQDGPFLLATAAAVFGIVAMIFLAVTMFLTPALIVDQKIDAGSAMVRSLRAVGGQFFAGVRTILPTMIVAASGAVLCGFGLVYTLPILYIAKAILYRDVFEAPKPPTPIEFEL